MNALLNTAAEIIVIKFVVTIFIFASFIFRLALSTDAGVVFFFSSLVSVSIDIEG